MSRDTSKEKPEDERTGDVKVNEALAASDPDYVKRLESHTKKGGPW